MRATVVLVVIALHGLAFTLLLLPARLPGIVSAQPRRETILYLWRAPPPVRKPGRPVAVPQFATGQVMRSLPALPRAEPGEGDLQGLATDLFSCRPEDIGSLSFDQQQKCAHVGLAALQPPPTVFAEALHMRNRGRWQTALALQKSAPLAPCFSHQGFSPLGTAFCFAEMLIDGYDQDNHEKYYLGGP